MKALVGHLFAGESPNAAGRAGPVTAPGATTQADGAAGPGLSAAIHPDGAPAGIRDQDAARVREIVG